MYEITYNYVLRFLMEINSKIHVEQTAPPGIHRQHSDKRDGQTDRQKNSTFLAAPAAGELNPSPTDLGTVTEDLEHVFAPRKLFGGLTHSFAATGC